LHGHDRPLGCWILFGACGAGNGGRCESDRCESDAIFFGNVQYHRLGTSTVEEDSDLLPRFQGLARANDLSLCIADNTVAAGEYRRRMEVRETSRQEIEVSVPGLRGRLPGAAQSCCQRFEVAGLAHWIGADQQQVTGEAEQCRPRLSVGLQQASAQAALQLVQIILVAGQVLRWALQSVCEPVQMLGQSRCWPRWLRC